MNSVTAPVVPMRPLSDELKDLFETDDSLFGAVYRCMASGTTTPTTIAVALGKDKPSPTLRSHVKIVNFLVFKEQLTRDIDSNCALRLMDKFLDQPLTSAMRSELDTLRFEICRNMQDPPREKKPKKKPKDDPGVYVYSYRQYLPRAFHDSVKAYYKVGCSKAMNDRTGRQGRSTEVPEDLEVVRRIPCDDPFALEAQLHEILEKAGCRAVSNKGGTEWFITTLGLIDTLAEALGYTVQKLVSPERERTGFEAEQRLSDLQDALRDSNSDEETDAIRREIDALLTRGLIR